MVSARLKFVAAQLGVKRGARAQLAQCLDPLDLGDAWRRIDQRTWRTGLSAGSNAWAAAANAAGSVTAWRSFKSGRSSRYLWIQLMPLARTEDGPAALSFASTPDNDLKNLRSKVKVTSTHDLDPAPEIEVASLVPGKEQHTTGPTGAGVILTLRFLVGRTVVIMSASSAGKDWAWPDLMTLAERQVARIV